MRIFLKQNGNKTIKLKGYSQNSSMAEVYSNKHYRTENVNKPTKNQRNNEDTHTHTTANKMLAK